MLAYLFWHAPAEGVGEAGYERAVLTFQRSLARTPPFGFRGSAVFRISSPPWSLRPGDLAEAGAARASVLAGPVYEDWYLVEDYAALGVLEEAAVGRGHRTSHDRVARSFGSGTAGLYRLLEGEVTSAEQVGRCPQATWVRPGRGAAGRSELGAFLGDGLDQEGTSLWRRCLVLGPAPEYCVLATEVPAGANAARLPAGWSAVEVGREAVFGSD